MNFAAAAEAAAAEAAAEPAASGSNLSRPGQFLVAFIKQ